MAHQTGVIDAPLPSAVIMVCDVTVETSNELRQLFHRLRGCAAPAGGTATVAVGASLFDDRFGLAPRRPRQLTTMPRFPNDVLDPAWCHGDVLVQVCTPHPEQGRRYADDLSRLAGWRQRWRIEGFRSDDGRNLFGFREGAGNPNLNDRALMDLVVWVQRHDEPPWTRGGTYQVVRLIRFATSLWDAESIAAQEAVFGRRKSDGAPLGQLSEGDDPRYHLDRYGQLIPLDAHIRRANPRTADAGVNRILRRGYSYRRGTDPAGYIDEGLIFMCFQRDLERGFAAIQSRLAGEALDRYVLPFGGGYFFVLPVAEGEYTLLAER